MGSVPLIQWSKSAIVAGVFGAAFVVASGAFFVETLLQTPPPLHAPIVAETTGRAPPQDRQEPLAAEPAPVEAAGPADCQTQTWPQIARPCLSNEQGPRSVRMITTDKLTEPAISVIEKPAANVIHQMAPPPAAQPASLFAAARAAAPAPFRPSLNEIAFAGRFDGTPATEKFEFAAAPAVAPAQKSEKPAAQKPAVKKQTKQKIKRQIARANDRPKSKLVAVISGGDNANAANRKSFSGTQSSFPSGGPFGALFR